MTGGIPFKDGALAFGLTMAAGMCTCLGAAVVFSPRLVSLANKKFLACSLVGAAGVMIYVSFVEIFQKSLVRHQAFHSFALFSPPTLMRALEGLFLHKLLFSAVERGGYCGVVLTARPVVICSRMRTRLGLKTRGSRTKLRTCSRQCAFSAALRSASS